jgi:C4-dicarboxylate-specific signal transduction histidine kinase
MGDPKSNPKSLQDIIDAQRLAVEEMASGIAHEINNPLAVARASLDFLKQTIRDKELTAEDLRAKLDLIDRSTQRIERVVRGLRFLSRNPAKEESRDTPLLVILDDLFGVCRQKAVNAGVDIRMNVPGTVIVRGHPIRLGQAILQILRNAIEAAGAGEAPRWVELSCSTAGPTPGMKAELKISDSGKGFDPAVKAKLFQPFVTTKAAGQGLGLGLSVAQTMIESEGGALRLEAGARPTTLVLAIPLAVARSKAA